MGSRNWLAKLRDYVAGYSGQPDRESGVEKPAGEARPETEAEPSDAEIKDALSGEGMNDAPTIEVPGRRGSVRQNQ